jgi:hypothetical protein
MVGVQLLERVQPNVRRRHRVQGKILQQAAVTPSMRACMLLYDLLFLASQALTSRSERITGAYNEHFHQELTRGRP